MRRARRAELPVAAEEEAGAEQRLARAVRLLGGDEAALAAHLASSVAPWQRQMAHLVLVREVGAERARALAVRAFGAVPSPPERTEAAAAAPLDEHTAWDVGRARHLSARLVTLTEARAPAADLQMLLAAVEDNVAAAALALARRHTLADGGNAATRVAALAGVGRPAPATERPAQAQVLASRERARSDDDEVFAGELLGRLDADGGAPLPEVVAARMAMLLGHDFAHVRVHADAAAAALAAQLGARAFTVGDDVYFAAGQWAPDTTAGERLLVHELTHVVQHDLGRLPAGGAALSHPDDLAEREARAAETLAVTAAPAVRTTPAPAPSRPRTVGARLLRAIGMELQTHLPVRDKDDRPLRYQQRIFTDRREAPKGERQHHFIMSVDTGPVAKPGTNTDEKKPVVEFVLPHVDTREEQKLIAVRAETMRRAIGFATEEAKKEAPIEEIVGMYQALLPTMQEGEKLKPVDVEDRAAGIALRGAILGQKGGSWRNDMTVDPQATFGAPMAHLLALLEQMLQDPALVANKSWAGAVLGSIEQLKGLELPPDTTALAALVEMYLSGTQEDDVLEYPKAALMFMARTDFHSMYAELDKRSREAWGKYAAWKKSQAKNAPVYKGGFAEGAEHGPLLWDWLESISEPQKFPLEQVDLNRLIAWLWSDLRAAFRWAVREAQGKDVDVDGVLTKFGPGAQKLIAILSGQAEAPSFVPQQGHVKPIFEALGEGGAFAWAFNDLLTNQQDLQSRDLMSRGAVNAEATSMGSMKVPKQGPEEGHAILEARIMQQWQGAAEAGDESWVDNIMAVFEDIKSRLESLEGSGGKNKRRLDEGEKEKKDTSNRSDGKEDEDSAPSHDRKRAPTHLGDVERDTKDNVTGVSYRDERWAVTNVNDDGDCFYRCVAQQELGDQGRFMELRNRLSQSAHLDPTEQPLVAQQHHYATMAHMLALAQELGIQITLHMGSHAGRTVEKQILNAGGRGDLNLLFLTLGADGHVMQMRRA